jgi:hypothetical protein
MISVAGLRCLIVERFESQRHLMAVSLPQRRSDVDAPSAPVDRDR